MITSSISGNPIDSENFKINLNMRHSLIEREKQTNKRKKKLLVAISINSVNFDHDT